MKHFFTAKYYKYLTQSFLVILLSVIAPIKPDVFKTGKSPSHIVFIEDSFDEALRQAAKQNKYVFVDAYATWCGPCKMLKAITFTNSRAADFYNNNFVNVSIDMEKGQGPQLAQKWGLRVDPTLIIFNKDGKPILGAEGYLSAKDLIRFGQQALKK